MKAIIFYLITAVSPLLGTRRACTAISDFILLLSSLMHSDPLYSFLLFLIPISTLYAGRGGVKILAVYIIFQLHAIIISSLIIYNGNLLRAVDLITPAETGPEALISLLPLILRESKKEIDQRKMEAIADLRRILYED
ncbi:MAG: hypothetical protein ACP5JF_03410 [Candidatus Methanodesulfokora sp.]